MNQALDDALSDLHAFGCELNNGLTNHAPMVAEALNHLGLNSAIHAWVSVELPRCLLRPKHIEPIRSTEWNNELGNPARFSDWAVFFQNEIGRNGWQSTLANWIPRFSPGFATAAVHGVIRTGHAARGLQARESNPRLLELADALASWACDFQVLAVPARPPNQIERANLSPSTALARVPLVPTDLHSLAGSITHALGILSDDQNFAEHFYILDVDDDLEELCLDIGATFARLFYQSAQSALGAIVFTHAITGIAAARQLLTYVPADAGRTLVQHAFHTGCALHAIYSKNAYSPPVTEPMPLEAEECIYDALEHGDEHVIKLTDTCVTFSQATGDAFFLEAAEKARRLLPPRRL